MNERVLVTAIVSKFTLNFWESQIANFSNCHHITLGLSVFLLVSLNFKVLQVTSERQHLCGNRVCFLCEFNELNFITMPWHGDGYGNIVRISIWKGTHTHTQKTLPTSNGIDCQQTAMKMKKKQQNWFCLFPVIPNMEFDNGLLKIEAENEIKKRERDAREEVNRNSFISVNRVAFVDPRAYKYIIIK